MESYTELLEIVWHCSAKKKRGNLGFGERSYISSNMYS